jgi:hypothetical protein
MVMKFRQRKRPPFQKRDTIVAVNTNRKRRFTQVFNPSVIPRGVYSKFASRGKLPEIKTLDTLFTGAYAAVYTPDTVPCQVLNTNTGTACVQALNLIQQGAGISQRIGHKVSLKSLRLRLSMEPLNNVDNGWALKTRILVMYDRNPDGTYPAMNVILANITQANQTQAGTYLDNLNPNFFDRFVVLMDKFITLPVYDSAGVISNSNQVGPTNQEAFILDEYIKLKDLETIYGNTANNLQTANPMTIAYIQTGALLIMSMGGIAAINSPYCFTGTARLRYRDN